MNIVVIAPNISENLSGEAIKAYQYVRHLIARGDRVSVIAHSRSRGHFENAAAGAPLHFVEDEIVQRLLWKSVALRPFVTLPFFVAVRRLVRDIAAREPDAVFHYLCPVSPIYPRLPVAGVRNVLGPVTGNIHYPPALRHREPFGARWRRMSHRVLQGLIGGVLRDKAKFDRILISGGERTRESLSWAGAGDDQFRDVLDSGVSDRILSRPSVAHEGVNHRFVCNGRLVPHKGVDLAIRAVARAATPVALDVFGDGPTAPALRDLIRSLGLEDRVRLRGWLPSHDDLLDEMAAYRGFVFPSMAEANGIVVQEALAMGLPVICLDWGGPALLASGEEAALIPPTGEEAIVDAIAAEMDRLAENPALAAARAEAARDAARRRFSWSAVADDWIRNFD
ncbi:MAG: glycosyltransferase family 4 protein [Parvularculaceae bacterium]